MISNIFLKGYQPRKLQSVRFPWLKQPKYWHKYLFPLTSTHNLYACHSFCYAEVWSWAYASWNEMVLNCIKVAGSPNLMHFRNGLPNNVLQRTTLPWFKCLINGEHLYWLPHPFWNFTSLQNQMNVKIHRKYREKFEHDLLLVWWKFKLEPNYNHFHWEPLQAVRAYQMTLDMHGPHVLHMGSGL